MTRGGWEQEASRLFQGHFCKSQYNKLGMLSVPISNTLPAHPDLYYRISFCILNLAILLFYITFQMVCSFRNIDCVCFYWCDQDGFKQLLIAWFCLQTLIFSCFTSLFRWSLQRCFFFHFWKICRLWSKQVCFFYDFHLVHKQ